MRRLLCSADVSTVNYSMEHPTEMEDEGFYLCNVTSDSGFEIGEINVDVLGMLLQSWKDKTVVFLFEINN